ncbi:hypothetical protein GCM10020229_51360 [Kitasatospora albolonga]
MRMPVCPPCVEHRRGDQGEGREDQQQRSVVAVHDRVGDQVGGRHRDEDGGELGGGVAPAVVAGAAPLRPGGGGGLLGEVRGAVHGNMVLCRCFTITNPP